MRTRSRLLFLSMMLLGVVIGLFLSAGLQRALSPSGQPAAEPVAAAQQGMDRAAAARDDLDPEERHTIALFKSASPSVAYITTQVEQVDFWTRSVTEIPSGTGSGFVWDERGHVVTNFHVVQDGDSAQGHARAGRLPGQASWASRATRTSPCCRSRPRARSWCRSRSGPARGCRSARRSTRSATRSASTTR